MRHLFGQIWSQIRQLTKQALAQSMKSTGHEKCRVSVCLTAKANGSKLKPFIVFKNAKHEAKALSEEFKT